MRRCTALPPLEGYTFEGYRNADGSVGTRNLLAITQTVQCMAGVTEHAVERIRRELLPKYPHVDDVVALEEPAGLGREYGECSACRECHECRESAFDSERDSIGAASRFSVVGIEPCECRLFRDFPGRVRNPVSFAPSSTHPTLIMAKTYAQLTQEIEALQTQAEAVLQREKSGVAARIREAIAIYGLTIDDLGLLGNSSRAKSGSALPKATGTAKKAGSPSVKFRDAAGHTWSGRGPKPGWLKAGLAAGKSLESFRVSLTGAFDSNAGSMQAAPLAPLAAPAKKQPKKGKQKYKSAVKYRGDAGQQWSGRGPKPGWVVAAVAAGKTLAQMAV